MYAQCVIFLIILFISRTIQAENVSDDLSNHQDKTIPIGKNNLDYEYYGKYDDNEYDSGEGNGDENFNEENYNDMDDELDDEDYNEYKDDDNLDRDLNENFSKNEFNLGNGHYENNDQSENDQSYDENFNENKDSSSNVDMETLNHQTQNNSDSDSYYDDDYDEPPLNYKANTEPGFDLSQDEIEKFKLWPDGIIPYYIDVYSFSDKVMRDKIRGFLNSVNSLTALSFLEMPRPPTENSRWVFFINRRGLLGCADHSIRNFTNVGVQHVVLGYHCMNNEGELAEAVLAIAGVPAQHNSPDRDYYIKIREPNIIPEKKYLFSKLYDTEWLFHDLEYDFHSAGHFHSYKHSVNGRATIVPQKQVGQVTLGETTALTSTDIQKLRMLYNYIAKKKTKESDCGKLFEPGENFHAYKPNSKDVISPRPKPIQYIGESQDEPVDSQDVNNDPDESIPDATGTKPDKANYGSDDDNLNTEVTEDYKTFNDETNRTSTILNVIDNHIGNISPENYSKENETTQASEEIDKFESSSTDDDHSDASKEKTPKFINLDKSSTVLVKLLGYVTDKQTTSSDLLNSLSDFHTDDEKEKRLKSEALNSVIPQKLKFKNAG